MFYLWCTVDNMKGDLPPYSVGGWKADFRYSGALTNSAEHPSILFLIGREFAKTHVIHSQCPCRLCSECVCGVSDPCFMAGQDRQLFATVLNRSRVSVCVALVALHFASRLRKLSVFSKSQLFVGSLILANKFVEDHSLQNDTWARLTSTKVAAINRLESKMLESLGHRLWVDMGIVSLWMERLRMVGYNEKGWRGERDEIGCMAHREGKSVFTTPIQYTGDEVWDVSRDSFRLETSLDVILSCDSTYIARPKTPLGYNMPAVFNATPVHRRILEEEKKASFHKQIRNRGGIFGFMFN